MGLLVGVKVVELAEFEVVQVWQLQFGIEMVVDQGQFWFLMSESFHVTGSASCSPNCVSVKRVSPGASDRLKADARQKSGTSKGPCSPSMPWVVVGRRLDLVMLMPSRNDLTRLPDACQ